MKSIWPKLKEHIETRGMFWVAAFVGLCWLYFIHFISFKYAAIAALLIVVLLLAVISYRILKIFL